MTEDRFTTTPPPLAAPSPYSSYGQPQTRSHSAWFWIAIIGGGLVLISPVLLIIAALAIPKMLNVDKNANESSATMTMRAIESAEASYVAAYPANGYACPLSLLGGDPGSGAPTAQAAQLIDPALAAGGYKRGYIFTITCGNKVSTDNHDTYVSYRLTAVPRSVGKTGDNGYCSDEKNFIRFDPTGGANCH